jgi:hypothetical protein
MCSFLLDSVHEKHPKNPVKLACVACYTPQISNAKPSVTAKPVWQYFLRIFACQTPVYLHSPSLRGEC